MNYDAVFHALSDSSRRDMLMRVLSAGRSISELAQRYAMSFAAVAKHVQVLWRAGLVNKVRRGKEQIVEARLDTIQETARLLARYEEIWIARLDRLGRILEEESNDAPEHR